MDTRASGHLEQITTRAKLGRMGSLGQMGILRQMGMLWTGTNVDLGKWKL